MKISNIRPIPKHIIAKIQRLDRREYPEQNGNTRLYSYLTTNTQELVKVTVAVKNHRKKWYAKQIAVHGVKSDECFVKDMEYGYCGGGFRFGWQAEGLYKYRKWFEDNKWYSAKSKLYNAYTDVINPGYIEKFPEYKYSAYRHFNGKCVIEYLKLYEKFPQTEYLLKLGLHGIYKSKAILKKVAADKKFCKWLVANKEKISGCYVDTIIRAYKTGKPLKQLQAFAEFKKCLNSDDGLKPIKTLFGKDLAQFFIYLEKQGAGPNSYQDYLKACEYLELDMSLPKNRFPHDFKHWHDVRIDEYHAAKALKNERERAELYAKFSAVVEKYLSLQHFKNGAFVAFIAKSPADLIAEGEKLNHCVGHMNYEQKMAREETLIFFIRNIEEPDVPFITMEYSPDSKKVIQCYGLHNSKPDEEVENYINKVWLPYANRTIRKISA